MTNSTTFNFTREELENITVPALRVMCVNELAIPGMTKKAKGIIIEAILAKYGTVKNTVISDNDDDTETSFKESLEEKTVDMLRVICKNRNLIGMSKKRKDIIIAAIVKDLDNTKDEEAFDVEIADDDFDAVETASGVMTGLESEMSSVLTDIHASDGNKTTTTIRISSGASAGEFPVIGRTVGEVSEFLREVLNVDRMSEGVINGDTVSNDYILKEGDSLEFLKPAGKKGIIG